MAKVSAKSRGKTGQSAKQSFKTAAPEIVEEAGELSPRVWKWASFSIIALSVLLRVYHLTLKPLHHDEGVNGFFLTRLMREGIYQYDPGNYHGPTIYYFGLLSTYLFGLYTFAVRFVILAPVGGVQPTFPFELNTIVIRLVTVLFGVGLVWLALCLRRYIGSLGALTAAGLIAISPGAVYLSRYFIHESLVVFFTFGLIVAVLKYHESEPPAEENDTSALVAVIAGVVLFASSLVAVYKPQYFAAIYKPQYFRVELLLIIVSSIVVVQALWHYDGWRAIYLILAATSAALLFASKETALVSVIVLGIAVTTTAVYLRFRHDVGGGAKKKRRDGRSAPQAEGWLRETVERFGGWTHIGVVLLVALLVFAFVNILFYSSFFTNAKGVGDSLQTFMIWAKTGKQEHVHPFYQHAFWLMWMESPVLMLGIVGAFVAVVRANNRFALFAAQWAFGILAAYSIVPYKTPWLALNFIIPLAVAGGYAVNEIYSWSKRGERLFVLAVLLIAAGFSGYQSIKLNFFRYDDDRYIYVYGHTYREFVPMVDEIKRIGQQTGLKEDLDIAILSPDYWPLPWYLRDYKRIGYFGQISPTNSSLVIINVSQEQQLLTTLEGRYKRINNYPLRPGVVLVLYARKDLNL